MKLLERIFLKISTVMGINLLSLAYKGIGISPDYEALTSGFFDQTLRNCLDSSKDLICFDVGANLGEVSKSLVETFGKATIHSFEPNPFTFLALQKNLQHKRVVLNNLGLGEKEEESSIYFYADEKTTGHASVYRDVFSLHNAGVIQQHRINLSTIDSYCRRNQIRQIDFLKIDTEGHEYAVLKGAVDMLSSGSISVIQFEFNEMNIVSRVFLKDFYELLTDFSFYRVKGQNLFPLGKYSSANEIFRIQNILAVHNKITM
jgi:FkbM family methyltransferase